MSKASHRSLPPLLPMSYGHYGNNYNNSPKSEINVSLRMQRMEIECEQLSWRWLKFSVAEHAVSFGSLRLPVVLLEDRRAAWKEKVLSTTLRTPERPLAIKCRAL
jgi:hypothetical protein